MNMKKTMAAIAAGAVAVSAMATSVSAIQDGVFTYNLVENYKQDGDPAKVTLEATINNADSTLTGITFVDTDGKIDVKNVVIKVASNVAGEQNKTYTYSTDQGAVNYNQKLNDGGLTFVNELNGYSNKVTITVTIDGAETRYGSAGAINKDINAGKVAITSTGDTTPTIVRSYTGAGDAKYLKFPLKTSTTGNVNIIDYLQNGKYTKTHLHADGTYHTPDGGMRTNDADYANVAAVLNDAIANYEGVVFKFNTAKQNIAWMKAPEYTDTVSVSGIDDWKFNLGNFFWDDGNGWSAMTNDDVRKLTLKDLATHVHGNEDGIVAAYVDYGGTDAYTKFNQHLYNGTVNPYYSQLAGNFAAEGTGYVGFDWNGYNLFQGALVINENLTMSLSDTEFFDYTDTSLSFDWDAVYSNAMTSNNFATYVQSIKLATSSTWYWDSMDIVLTAGSAEDASSGAGVTGDDETLDGDDDTDADDDISLDDDGDDDVDTSADDDDDDVDTSADDDDDTNDTEAPAQTTNNPQTGNASVALAVIPVALAAAAIVAKKRG